MRKYLRLVAAVSVIMVSSSFMTSLALDNITILVLPFENSTGEEKLEPLEEGLRDLIIADLGRVKGIVVVERDSLDKIIEEQKLSLRGLIDKETQVKIGKLAGANIMLAGGFTLIDGIMKINAHLLDVETTELIKSEEIEGKVTDIVQLSKELTLRLLRDLDIKIESLPELDVDKSPKINLHFIRGLGYYYGCMYDHAIMEFMNALALNPNFIDARFWMGRSYLEQGEFEHARIEFKRLMKDFPEHDLTGKAAKLLQWKDASAE